MKTALIVAFVLVSTACGGKAKPDSASQPADMSQEGQRHDMDHMGHMGHMGEPGHMGSGDGHGMAQHGPMDEKSEMAAMPPSVAKFHDTLAPRWHAEHGPARMADTCGAIGQLKADASAIVAAPVPDGANPASWSAGGSQLVEAVGSLEATCKAKDAAAFEPAFERVHTSFHHVMQAASMHDEHGDAHHDHEH
jgi:hypothetical protein